MDKPDTKMEDAAEPTAGADGAEQKKQYLLDRIATSDGFKDAKAHKEEDAPAAALAALVRRVHQRADVGVQHAALRHDQLSIFQRVARERFQVVYQ